MVNNYVNNHVKMLVIYNFYLIIYVYINFHKKIKKSKIVVDFNSDYGIINHNQAIEDFLIFKNIVAGNLNWVNPCWVVNG